MQSDGDFEPHVVGTSKGRLSRVLSPNPYERCCRATICASGTGAARQEDKYLLDACVTSCYNVGHGPGLADWPWTEVRLAPLSLPRSTHHSSAGYLSAGSKGDARGGENGSLEAGARSKSRGTTDLPKKRCKLVRRSPE